MAGRGVRILVGCAIGCGAIILAGVIAALSFGYWVTRPGTLLEAEKLVAPDTTGHVEWTLRREDPGTLSVLEGVLVLFQEARGAGPSPFPAPVRGWLEASQARNDRQQLEALLPISLTWTARGEGGEEPVHALVVSLGGLGKRITLIDWFLDWIVARDDRGESFVHRGERVVTTDGAAWFIRGNDVFVTSGADVARALVDRLAIDAGAPAESTDLSRRLAALPEEAALRGVLVGPALEVLDRIGQDEPAPDDLAGAVRAIGLEGGFAEGANLAVRVAVECDDPSAAQEVAQRIAGRLAALELPIEVASRTEGAVAHLDLRIADVPSVLGELAARAARAAEDAAEKPSVR